MVRETWQQQTRSTVLLSRQSCASYHRVPPKVPCLVPRISSPAVFAWLERLIQKCNVWIGHPVCEACLLALLTHRGFLFVIMLPVTVCMALKQNICHFLHVISDAMVSNLLMNLSNNDGYLTHRSARHQ